MKVSVICTFFQNLNHSNQKLGVTQFIMIKCSQLQFSLGSLDRVGVLNRF